MDPASLIMALTVLSGLYLAWCIGANDVANAVGTSVGSGAMTLGTALVLAAVFEAAGAFLAGGRVTQTLSEGLVSMDAFGDDALVLSAAMAGCMIASAIWLNFASYMGWPVSTTHCIVGGVLGAGLSVGGFDALVGSRVAAVGAAWILSPLFAIWLGFQSYAFIRHRILGADDPLARIRGLGPVLIGGIVALLTVALLFRGEGPVSFDLPLWAAGGVALVAALLAGMIARPFFGRMADGGPLDRIEGTRRTEHIFQRLQILAACALAFAHGSNDIANAVAPVAVVFHALRTGVTEQVVVPPAVLLVGVVGLVIGLVSYGYKVMATVGKDITELNASSGCAAAFSAAVTILVGTKLGLPVSTTHILVGAVIGVGFGRGVAAINVRVLRIIVASWLVTVPVTAGMTAGVVVVAQALLA